MRRKYSDKWLPEENKTSNNITAYLKELEEKQTKCKVGIRKNLRSEQE